MPAPDDSIDDSTDEDPTDEDAPHEDAQDDGDLDDGFTGGEYVELEGFPEGLTLLREDPIPPELYSVYEGGPFTRCVGCQGLLADVLHQIQKVYRGSEVVFEMAVCQACAEGMSEEFSEESLAVMQEFMQRIARSRAEADRCRTCDRPVDEFRNSSLIGVAIGSSLLVPPLRVCEECELGVQERLSRKTRDAQGDFLRDKFPGVPAGLDISPIRTF